VRHFDGVSRLSSPREPHVRPVAAFLIQPDHVAIPTKSPRQGPTWGRRGEREYLSNYFAISKYHLCRSFKKYTGYTLTEYITQLRMDRAKELLKTTTLAANQIAAVVGIADENYFYRLFKKYVGISAHKYRKSC